MGPPVRSSFDPILEKPWLTPYMFIYETVNNVRDLRLRLIGTQIVELFGSDPTGQCLSEFWVPEEFESMLASYQRSVKTGQPFAIKGSYYWKDRGYIDWYCVICPLKVKADHVEQFLGILCPSPAYNRILAIGSY